VTPRPNRGPVGDAHRQRRFNPLSACHQFEFKVDLAMDIASEAARLRTAAEARPLRLPINRNVDESHHAITPEGLSVWYTIQVSPHSRIQEVVFERVDRLPTEEECQQWLELLIVGAPAIEAPGFPGAMTRRFEAFERNPELEAPIA